MNVTTLAPVDYKFEDISAAFRERANHSSVQRKFTRNTDASSVTTGSGMDTRNGGAAKLYMSLDAPMYGKGSLLKPLGSATAKSPMNAMDLSSLNALTDEVLVNLPKLR